MNTGVVAAICVTVFGFLIIVAVVWLFYQYRLTKLSLKYQAESEPPVRKLIVHRGQVVPASKLTSPSIRSGWSSLKHRSWLLSAPSVQRLDEGTLDSPPSTLPPHMRQYTPSHLEAGLLRKGNSLPNIKTVLVSRTMDDNPSTLTLPSQASLPNTKTPVQQFWSKRYPTPGSSEEKHSSEGTFYDDTSSESLPNFPRPPYLSPLQSRYNMQQPPRVASPLSQIHRNSANRTYV